MPLFHQCRGACGGDGKTTQASGGHQSGGVAVPNDQVAADAEGVHGGGQAGQGIDAPAFGRGQTESVAHGRGGGAGEVVDRHEKDRGGMQTVGGGGVGGGGSDPSKGFERPERTEAGTC